MDTVFGVCSSVRSIRRFDISTSRGHRGHFIGHDYRSRNRNRDVQASKSPLESQAQDTRLFTGAGQIRRVNQRIVNGRFRSVARGSEVVVAFVVVVELNDGEFMNDLAYIKRVGGGEDSKSTNSLNYA